MILRVAGRGGMGLIYEARDTVLRREVALKMLPPAQLDSPAGRERFVREAQAAAKIRHPNVVAVHDVVVGPTPSIVMEYLRGQTFEHGRHGDAARPVAARLTDVAPPVTVVASRTTTATRAVVGERPDGEPTVIPWSG